MTSTTRAPPRNLLLALMAAATASPLLAAEPSDILRFGDPASEAAHGLSAQASETATGAHKQPLRRFLPLAKGDWRGGAASFRLKVKGDAQNYLTARLWGEDVNGNQSTLYCEGKQLGQRHASDVDILDQGAKYPVSTT